MSSVFFAVESLTKRVGGLTAINKMCLSSKRDEIVERGI